MHPIPPMLGLLVCIWIGYWAYDMMGDDDAAFAFFIIWLDVLAVVAIVVVTIHDEQQAVLAHVAALVHQIELRD